MMLNTFLVKNLFQIMRFVYKGIILYYIFFTLYSNNVKKIINYFIKDSN